MKRAIESFVYRAQNIVLQAIIYGRLLIPGSDSFRCEGKLERLVSKKDSAVLDQIGAPEGAIEPMLDIFANLFAYGPPGGITPGVAVKWTVIWTVLLGGSLYVSLFYPQWLRMDDEH